MKSTYILGAGVSSLAGVPTLNEFLPKAFSEVKLKLGNDMYGKACFGSVEKFWKDELPNSNVEELLSFIDFKIAIAKDSKVKELKRIRSALIYLITTTIKQTIKDSTEISDMYHKFVHACDFNKSQILTFNWDLLIDNRFGQKIDYGSKIIKKHPESNSVTSQCEYNVPFLKLHGSINWLYCDDCMTTYYFFAQKSGQEYYEGKNKKCINSQCNENKLKPLLVLPTFKKFEKERKGGKKSEYDSLGEIWRNASRFIKECDKIVIIGFSFPLTDQHFRLFLKNALTKRQNVKLKIVEIEVVSNNKSSLKEQMDFEEMYKNIFESMGIKHKIFFDYSGFDTYVRSMKEDKADKGDD